MCTRVVQIRCFKTGISPLGCKKTEKKPLLKLGQRLGFRSVYNLSVNQKTGLKVWTWTYIRTTLEQVCTFTSRIKVVNHCHCYNEIKKPKGNPWNQFFAITHPHTIRPLSAAEGRRPAKTSTLLTFVSTYEITTDEQTGASLYLCSPNSTFWIKNLGIVIFCYFQQLDLVTQSFI